MVRARTIFLRPEVLQGAHRRPTGRNGGDGLVKLLQVYNDYRSCCGGEVGVVQMIAATVEKHGGQSRLLRAPSKGLTRSFLAKVRGFAARIYSRSAYREMAETLDADRPDVVHVHNLYPLFSPAVLVACRRAGVPVVMTNHNYLLTCPIVSHLSKGRVCEKCVGGRGPGVFCRTAASIWPKVWPMPCGASWRENCASSATT